MLIVGAIAFRRGIALRRQRLRQRGALQFILYRLVGLVPAMLSSWLAQDKKAA